MSIVPKRSDKPKKLKSVSKKKYKPHYYGRQQLKATQAWKTFSQYIRRRDGACVSCGARKNWKELDAGHFIPGSTCPKALFFSEINVGGQCTGCNRFKHGNGSGYALFLTRKHGAGILEEFDRIAREEKEKGIICRFSKEELKAIEEKYQHLLTSL